MSGSLYCTPRRLFSLKTGYFKFVVRSSMMFDFWIALAFRLMLQGPLWAGLQGSWHGVTCQPSKDQEDLKDARQRLDRRKRGLRFGLPFWLMGGGLLLPHSFFLEHFGEGGCGPYLPIFAPPAERVVLVNSLS